MRLTSSTTALLLALALAGCSGDDPVAVATSGPPSVAVPTDTPDATTEPSGPPTSGTPVPGTPPPTEPASAGEGPIGPVVAPSEESTSPRSEPPPAEVVRITSVSATATDGAEQLTITSEGGIPGWTARYVDIVRIDGEPVLTEGDAAMEIVLQAANPNAEQGLAPEVANGLSPDQPLLREVVMARYLGDMVVFAVGVSREVPFSVATTATTIVVTFHG